MKAEVVGVGTELLMGQIVNTNGAEIARMLAEIGVGVYYQSVVGDNRDRLAEALETALERADVVVACGGLGPTDDDLTRETLAEVTGRSLRRNEEWARHLEEIFERRRKQRRGLSSEEDYPFPRNNLRQAMVPEGAVLLPNSRGTAPGIYLEHEATIVVLLPGPPGEMRTLMREEVLPRLAQDLSARGEGGVLLSRVLRVIGLGESRVAELLEPILSGQTNPTIAPLAHLGEMHLRITAHAPDEETARRYTADTAAEIRSILGDAVYGEDDTTLEAVVGEVLAERGLTVAVAESCTGGLLGHRITNVPGSSRYFRGGIMAYSNELKSALLGIESELIVREGAVSEPVSRAMARGARESCGSDLSVGITGVAGPSGGTPEKPVGLTYVTVADDQGDECRTFQLPGDREEMKLRTTTVALEMLRRRLLSRASAGRAATTS